MNSIYSKNALIIVLLINILWASNWIVGKQLVDATSPFIAGAMRQTIVFIACLPWLKRGDYNIRFLLIYTVFAGSAFFLLANMGYKYSDNVGALAIGGQLGVPFVIILGRLFFRETISKRQLLGMIIAFSGVTILLFDPAIFSESIGLLFITASSLAWAIPQLLQRRLIHKDAEIGDVITLVAWSGLAGMVSLWPMAWLFEPASLTSSAIFSWHSLGLALFSGLGAGVIANIAMMKLNKDYGASKAVPLTLPNIAIAVIASAYVFARPITIEMMVGGAIVFLGLFILATKSDTVVIERG